MTMDQEKQPHIYHSAEESPIPVPPVEEGWSMMKQQLDIHQPATSRWTIRLTRPAIWLGAAAVVVTGLLTLWPGKHPHSLGANSYAPAVNTHAPGATSHSPTASPRGGDPSDQAETLAGPNPSNKTTLTPITGDATRPGEDHTTRPNIESQPSTTTRTWLSPAADKPSHSDAPSLTNGLSHSDAPSHTNGLSRAGMPSHTNGSTTRRTNQTTATRNSRHIRTSQNPGNNPGNHTSIPGTDHDQPSAGHDRTGHDQADHDQTGRDRATHDRDRTNHHRTNSSPTLVKTTSPSPKFISAADSLLRTIRSGSKNNTVALNKKPAGLTLEAGLSLGQSIPIGHQKMSSYNLLSDYIPSPYLRLSIGDRWYLQTAPRINSAQYTRPQLIDSSGGDTTHIPGYPQYLQYNRITLKKLYYTDIPLTINYRAFKGLYLGAGIQYSRLWQAAGEDRITLRPSNGLGSDTLISSKTIGLKKKDSVFRKLSGSDWRLLLEANYTWRQFTFGLQYQQGLKTFLPANTSGPKSTDKNSSFSIHVYYEIWNQSRKSN